MSSSVAVAAAVSVLQSHSPTSKDVQDGELAPLPRIKHTLWLGRAMEVAFVVLFGVVWTWVLCPLYSCSLLEFSTAAMSRGWSERQALQLFHLLTSVGLSNGIYWVCVLGLAWLDFHPTPTTLAMRMQQATQRGGDAGFSKTKWWKAVRMSLRNQLCVSIPYGLFVAYFDLMRLPASPTEAPPGYFTFLAHMVVILLVEEFGFYYAHRWLHTPWLYKHVHKAHHEFVAPFGASGIACHPFEHFLANVSPVVLGPMLAQSHLLTYLTWLVLGVADVVVVGHSGYHFPWMPSGEGHDWHHLRLNECFGPLGILDALHGTNTKFRASMQGARNHMFTSVREFQIETLKPVPRNVVIDSSKQM